MSIEPENRKDIDIVDGVVLAAGAVFIGAIVSGGGSLAVSIPVFIVYLIQHAGRRTKRFESFVDSLNNPKTEAIARNFLLPPPKEDTQLTLYQDKPIDVNVVGMNTERGLFQKMINPEVGERNPAITGIIEKNTLVKQQQTMVKAIRRLPTYISYKDIPDPPARLAVPIGIDSETKQLLWADFGNDLDIKILHALVAGYTGSGKDALLRLWFSTLTAYNTPEDMQFVVIDGKVDWLSPALAESAYMAIPPSGGSDIQKIKGEWIDCAIEHMEASFEWIFEEIHRRQVAFAKVGAVDMTSYTRKTGIKLPMLFVIASDVGETFDKKLKMLVNQLIMKGRAYGVRLIISLQNPVGEATKWRSQIGLIMTGHQPNPDHDRYVLGLNVGAMQYRPSLLPNPDETVVARGLFVVRRGSSQHLVRTPHLPEDDWFQYIETTMETKGDHKVKHNMSLLEQMLLEPPKSSVTKRLEPVITKPNKVLLTKRQIDDIIALAMNGHNKTYIMVEYLKATNAERYKELSPVVDRLVKAVKDKMQ